MTTAQKHDDDIETTLRRAAGYLTRRGSEYLENPVPVQESDVATPHRYKRVLIGTAAAATLCVTALAGSFIGGSSSGKVDVAQAAWSAIPATPTAEQVKKVQLDCGITAETLATNENVPPNSIPDYMLEPALVDVRGTTTTGVYFTWTLATLCVQFGDGSIQAPQVSMAKIGESAWKEPIALDLFADFPATMILGFLPPNISDTDPNSTGESDKIIESQWEAYIDGPGIERTQASVNGALERFVAWVPATGEFKITFMNTKTGEERVVETRTGSLGVSLLPQTTVGISPND